MSIFMHSSPDMFAMQEAHETGRLKHINSHEQSNVLDRLNITPYKVTCLKATSKLHKKINLIHSHVSLCYMEKVQCTLWGSGMWFNPAENTSQSSF